MIDTYGEVWKITKGSPPYQIEPLNIKLNLEKDNIDDQSEETIKWLNEIIN